jgi:integrase
MHPRVVTEILGHSGISVTVDIYGHVLPATSRAATAALEELLRTEDGGLSTE